MEEITDDYIFTYAQKGYRPFYDVEWYAVDPDGRVAAFFTAGFGAIPMLVFRDRISFFEVRRYFNSLPIRCGHTLHTSYPCNDFSSNAAQRGLFVYDWDSALGQYDPAIPYRLAASPALPLKLSDLPVSIAKYVAPLQFAKHFGGDLFPQREFAKTNV
jgi:hypothetical protein